MNESVLGSDSAGFKHEEKMVRKIITETSDGLGDEYEGIFSGGFYLKLCDMALAECERRRKVEGGFWD